MKKRFTFLFAMLAALVTTATADDVISASPLSISQSGTADLTINLKNTGVVRGIQFTVTLPEGVTVQESEQGYTGIEYTDGNGNQTYKPAKSLQVSLTKRTEGWWVLGNDVSTAEKPRTYKFVLIDPSTNGLAANGDGAIMRISMAAAAGTYKVNVSDIHMSTKGSNDDAKQNPIETDVVVSNPVKGDVNGNGTVDIDDPVRLLEYLADINERPFIAESAYINNNTIIDISDPVWLLEYLAGMRELTRGQIKVQEKQEETEYNLPDPE